MAMLKKGHWLHQSRFRGKKFDQMIVCMNQTNMQWLTYQVNIEGDCEYNKLNIYSGDSHSTTVKPYLLNRYILLKFFLVLNYLKLTTKQKEKMKQKFVPAEMQEYLKQFDDLFNLIPIKNHTVQPNGWDCGVHSAI